jgi:hypothetical protein
VSAQLSLSLPTSAGAVQVLDERRSLPAMDRPAGPAGQAAVQPPARAVSAAEAVIETGGSSVDAARLVN